MPITKERRKQRELFVNARRVEGRYAAQLRKVARTCGDIVKGFDHESPEFLVDVTATLRRYSELLRPWATATARRVVLEVSRKDTAAWGKLGADIGETLRAEIADAPTGQLLRDMLAEHVHYITSLPLDAAHRVHKLVTEAKTTSSRASEIAQEIRRTGEVSASRATLIARTEVARTASGLTMARARHLGSTGYVWRTARDADVRSSHKRMEGKFVAWDQPPQLNDGTVAHAGMIYNCRCWPEPVLPDRFD